MKKFLFLLAMIVSFTQVIAEGQKEPNEGNHSGSVIILKATTGRPQHSPANVDILLIIGDSDVTIRFNGDFGIGTYQLTDISTGNSISNTIDVCAGYSEVIPFVSDTTSSIEFSMVFEDGSFCHLSTSN